MANVAWSSYLPDLLVEVPGVPTPIAESKIRDALIEFCYQSSIWRQDLSPIDVTEDVDTYTLTNPTGAQIVTPHHVEFDDTPVLPIPEDLLDHVSRNWRNSELGYHFFMEDPNTLRLTWLPRKTITGGLDVGVVLKPSRSSADAPDWLFENWKEPIVHGAAARCLEMPNKRWSAVGTPSDGRRTRGIRRANSSLHWDRFWGGVSKALGVATKSHTRTGTRVEFTPFA